MADPKMKKMNCPCPDCPKAGDNYKCDKCGMALTITANCQCADPDCVSLSCCGQCMTKQP